MRDTLFCYGWELQMGRAHDCENLGNGSYRCVAHMIVKTLGMGATDGSRTSLETGAIDGSHTWSWKPWEWELQMGRAHDCENLGNGSYRWVAHMIVKTLGMGATDVSRTWLWKPWVLLACSLKSAGRKGGRQIKCAHAHIVCPLF